MNRDIIGPEAQLLLLTAAVSPSETALHRLLGAGLDWNELYRLARHEKAASIVIRELRRLELTAPDAGYGELVLLARSTVMRLLRLEQLLHQAVDCLGQQGIDAMLLKGAGLAYTAYLSFADRPMGDLDLLVRPEHAERAWSALQTLGWHWPSAQWARGRYTAHQHLPPLIQEPGGFRLEIHTALMSGGHPFRPSEPAFWERQQQVPLHGQSLLVPHPVHQLWHACVHFAWSHEMAWGAWRTMRDCGAILRRRDIDWAEFVGFATESRAGTCCYWTLRLARRLAAADVPDDVLAALRPPRTAGNLDRLERHYVCNLFPSPDRCPSVWLGRRLWEAGIAPVASGHGSARPWQVTERWVAGAGETRAPEVPPPRSTLMRFRKLGAWLAYLRWIRRSALPSIATR